MKTLISLISICLICCSCRSIDITNATVWPQNSNDIALRVNGPAYISGGNGDANTNGAITSLDITLIRRWLLYGTNFTAQQLAVSDVNGDGKVDVLDADLIRKVILGTMTSDSVSSYGKWIASRSIYCDADGNVGIGTIQINPGARLEIVGNTNTSPIIKLSNCNTNPPSNDLTPVNWLSIIIDGQTNKIPLYK